MTVVDELERLGTSLGDLAFVQGPGGNVSIKDGEHLYVKASGVRLRDVRAHHSVVPLDEARRALEGDSAADAAVFAVKPRPSLETYFHVLGPRVVAHTHALGVLLAACSGRVGELGVKHIPYERPGRGVALAVRDAFGTAGVSGAIVLESHGVIVFASTVDEAVAETKALDARARALFTGALPDVAGIHERNMSGEAMVVAGGLARRLTRRHVSSRYLFPDAVVYASHLRVARLDVPTAERALTELPRPSVLFDDAGDRWVVARTADQLAYAVEVTTAHDWVEESLVSRGCARYLDDDEPARILDLPAEKYRLTL